MDVTWPADIVPDSFDLTISSNSNSYKSVFTGSSQTAQFPGTRFKLNVGIKNLNSAQSKRLLSFLAKMDGYAGRCEMSDPSVRASAVQGTPVVSAATGNNVSIATSGWTPGATVLKEGSYISFNSGQTLEIKIVTADVVADSKGLATIPVMPWIRKYPATGSAIEVAAPKGRYRLDNADNGKSVSDYDNHTYSLTFVEAFYG